VPFSHDGKHLISGSGDNSAIIWDTEGRKLLYRLQGHNDDIYAVGFTPDGGRAVTGSIDATLRLWRVSDGSLIAELKGHKEAVKTLAIRSSDGMIASGDFAGEIRLWDGKDGHFLRTLAKQSGTVGVLRFSLDGQQLLSTSGYAARRPLQRVWEVATGKELVSYAGHNSTVSAAAISPDGRLAATGGGSDDEINIWELAIGATVEGPNRKPLVLAGTGRSVWAAGFSSDGQRFAWGNTWRNDTTLSSNPLEHQMRLPSKAGGLGRPEPIDEATARSFVRARATSGPYALSHRKGGTHGHDAVLDIKKDGTVVASIKRDFTDGIQHLAYTFTPDGSTIVSGGAHGVLTAYDLEGRHVADFVGHESDVWALAPSPDGRYLVSCSGDHSVRLWNLKTGELILTLFNGTDGEWVMWTPQGYYTGSPGADKIVGWQINKGPDQAADT
jgi:WD40 repeat protein